MFPTKPNPVLQDRAGNELLGGISQFSDNKPDLRKQLIAARCSPLKTIAPDSFGEAAP